MTNKVDKFFNIINNKKFQDNLKKINLLIAFFSLVFLIRLFSIESINIHKILNISIVDLIFLTTIYFNNAYVWTKFTNLNSKFNYKVLTDWAFSQIGKYVPGGIGLTLIRLNQDGDENKTKKIIFGLAEEQFLYPALSLPTLIFVINFINYEYFILIYVVTQIIFVYSFKYFYLLNKRIKKHSIINFTKLIIFSLLSSNLLVFYIFYNQNIEDYLFNGLIYLIAANIGLFFVGVPAGVGVREAIFFLLIGSFNTAAEYVEVLIYIRILYLVVDIIFGLYGYFIKLKNR